MRFIMFSLLFKSQPRNRSHILFLPTKDKRTSNITLSLFSFSCALIFPPTQIKFDFHYYTFYGFNVMHLDYYDNKKDTLFSDSCALIVVSHGRLF